MQGSLLETSNLPLCNSIPPSPCAKSYSQQPPYLLCHRTHADVYAPPSTQVAAASSQPLCGCIGAPSPETAHPSHFLHRRPRTARLTPMQSARPPLPNAAPFLAFLTIVVRSTALENPHSLALHAATRPDARLSVTSCGRCVSSVDACYPLREPRPHGLRMRTQSGGVPGRRIDGGYGY
ncbi:hypothetical protein B0H10DRAFT_2223186 [Mycena sp. CBHHK59/15]|nr:hypothetical protein B0H10DRAFT_2223524 [Mycena sp. CBHHK59/15]KAJ6612336.1 hypothetical protein B0H10DRAFT_2223186 [Mycena sp. CBHHK59/15]